MDSIVTAADVHRRYGEGDAAVDALAGVSVGFERGAFSAIMGPSGSGKSTLMHILAGLDRPTSGAVALDGEEITGLDDAELTRLRRDKLGFVFQFFNLIPVLTAEENVLLPLSIAGRKPDEDWFKRLIDTVDLGDRLTHRPAELSGGQQQRVAVARALVSRPAVVFADEPTGNLDSRSSEEVLGLLRTAVDEFGQTVVMVTHDPEAASYADRLVVLRDGQVVHDGDAGSADDVIELMKEVALSKVALRGIGARKMRAFTTWLAIFLGVALVAGTYVLTDTINKSFGEIFSESLKGTDVAITARQDVQTQDATPPGFPARLLERVDRVEGVEAASGSVFASGRFVDAKGDPIGNSFAPNFISSLNPARFESLDYVEGRKPRSDSEVSIDTQTADTGDLKIGGRLRLAGVHEAKTYRIVGLTKLGDTSFGGAGIAQVLLPEAQRITDREGQFDQISVAAADGVTPEQLRDRIAKVMPHQVQVETGEQAAKRQTSDIEENLSFLRIALLVFAGVSLFVGAFQIFNTFSITVAQRTREFGMLRTLGASRRQILATVGIEALTLGLLGAAVGLLGGVAFAYGINALFKAVGIDLPSTGAVIATRTVIVSLIVGVVVTVFAALNPALRATRVTPMAALREAELQDTKRRGRVVLAFAIGLGAIGLAMMLVGLFGGIEDSGSAAGLLGGGAALILFGVSLFSPRLVKPLASVTGRPLERLRGLTGRLARENAMRKPGRTASTAAALMIGLALIVFVTVFAAGINSSVAKTIDESFRGEIAIQNTDGFSPFPREALDRARQVDGVQSVSAITYATGELSKGGGSIQLAAVDPRTLGDVLALEFQAGGPSAFAALGPHDAILEENFAKSKHLGIGDTLRVRTPTDRTATFRVLGTVKGELDLLGKAIIDDSATRQFGRLQPNFALARLAADASPKDVQKAMEDALEKRYPTVEVQNQSQLKDQNKEQVNQLLGLIYALLSLAIVVSVFGIVNTLALSIHERTRELGMLRAVGMSRRQVRTMVRYEAVITALIGAILGTVLGCVFAALVSRPLADEGFTLSYPVATLIVLLVLAALAGVVAAIGPARRASRLDVLQALAYE